jgi:hypothetical protein
MTEAAESPQGRRLSIAHLALLAPWVALVIGSWEPIGDNSFLWHIRAGTVQAGNGAVLTTDPFSFTVHGESWLTQSWLVELLYGWNESIFGLGFVPTMILVVGLLTFASVGVIAFGRSKSVPATAFVLVLTTIVLTSFLVPRPVLFSFLLFALVIISWDRPQLRWTVPFLFWIWASVHASFVIGLGYVGLSILMDREWRAISRAVVSGLVTLVTAHGIGVLQFLVNFGENREALDFLSEWRRPALADPFFIAFLGGLVFIVIGLIRRKVPLRYLWLIIPFGALGLSSVRAIPPAWLGLVPVVALSLNGLSIGSRAGLRPRLAVIFAVFVLLLPFLLSEDAVLSKERFPLDARLALDDSPVFHDDRTGGYLIWAEGPERLVYLDDRAELYGWRLEEYVQVRSGEKDWRPVFERDGIGQALLASDEELVSTLGEAGWREVYADQYFTVLRP